MFPFLDLGCCTDPVNTHFHSVRPYPPDGGNIYVSYRKRNSVEMILPCIPDFLVSDRRFVAARAAPDLRRSVSSVFFEFPKGFDVCAENMNPVFAYHADDVFNSAVRQFAFHIELNDEVLGAGDSRLSVNAFERFVQGRDLLGTIFPQSAHVSADFETFSVRPVHFVSFLVFACFVFQVVVMHYKDQRR